MNQEKLLSTRFDSVGIFNEGLCSVMIAEKWGFIDITGELIIDTKFDDASYFSDGIANVKKDGKWGFIDKKGDYVISPQFDDARGFSEGFAPIKIGDKWGYIYRTENRINRIIDPRFEDAGSFHEGVAGVKIGDKWGFIDKKGKIIIEPKFEIQHKFIRPFFSMGKARVMIDGRWESIDRTGSIAGNWEYCIESNDSIWYYDKKNITRPTKNIVRVWVQVVYKEESIHSKNLFEVDCIEKKNRILSFTLYDKDGGVKNSYTPQADKLGWKFIVPGSVLEGVYETVCK